MAVELSAFTAQCAVPAFLLNLELFQLKLGSQTSKSVEKLQKFLDDTETHWYGFQSHLDKKKNMEAEFLLIHLLFTSNHCKNSDQEHKDKFAEIIKDVRPFATVEVNQLLDQYTNSTYSWDEFTEITKRLASGDLTGLEIRLPGLQHALGYSLPNADPQLDTGNIEIKTETNEKKQKEDSHKDLLSQLGLLDYYPNQISLHQATEIRACPDTLKVCDLPWKLIRMLVRLDSRARDLYLDEMTREQDDDDGFKPDLGEYEESDKSILPPNPMDVLLATFLCCDGVLKQVVTQKLFLCKLAIPFLYPVGTCTQNVFSLWPLRAIIVQYQDASRDTIDTSVTDHSSPIITFVRLGNPSVSKSKLLNDVLTGGSHETFYSSRCHKRTEKRSLAEGTLECAWFLPAFKGKDMLPKVTLFLNLRGDGSVCQMQMNLVNKISSVVVVVANVQDIAKHPHLCTFSKLCKAGKNVVLILTSECKAPDMKIAQREWQSCITEIGEEILKGIQMILPFKKHMKDADIKMKLQTMMPKLLEKSSNTSLEEVAKMCRKEGIHVDEDSSACAKGRQLAQDIMKEMEGRQLVECKRDLLPLQGKTWQEYSRLLKQHHRAGWEEESSVSQHKIQKEMMTLRRTQVEMCINLTPFIATFLRVILNVRGDDRMFFLRWMKLLLDRKSRQNLPQLNRHYNKSWDEFQEAKSLPLKTDEEMAKLREEVDQSEQNIAEASFGLEHIFRELGQIYEAVNESSLPVDKAVKSSLERLPRTAAELLLNGTPLELLDGEASSVPTKWVKAVLSELNGIIEDQRLLVVSVLGVQNSGKSTLLNTMFGLEFSVSASRCTRGAFMQVIRLDRPDLPARYIAVIDTEGLRAPELAQLKHNRDNELATFAIGLGDTTLINNKGGNPGDIKDVLEIAVHAFIRMKIANKSLNVNQRCIFIHQNVSAVDAKEKMRQGCQKFQEQLDLMTQEAAKSQNIQDIRSFSQIIQFDIKKHVWYFLNLWHGNPPMAPVNHEYSESAETVKGHLLETFGKASFLSVPDFALRIQDLWNGILAEDFIFSFRNSLEMKAYNAMETKYCGLRWELQKYVTDWIQQTAEIKMKKCETVRSLESVGRDQVVKLKTKIKDETERKEQSLTEFFEKSDQKDIVIQWKTGKIGALRFASEQLEIEGTRQLARIQKSHHVDLLSRQKSGEYEDILMIAAMTLADTLKGAKITDEDLKRKFDAVWTPLVDKLTPLQCEDVHIDKAIETILMELYRQHKTTIKKKLGKHSLSSPLQHSSLAENITQNEVKTKYFSFETSFVKGLAQTLGFQESRKDIAQKKTFEATRSILAAVDGQLSNFNHKDISFQKAHAESVLRYLDSLIDNFNKKEAKRDKFSLLPGYAVKLAVLVSRRCVKVFSDMQSRYEEKHGVASKLEMFREETFATFKLTVEQSAEEHIAADSFCRQLEQIVKNKVESDITGKVSDEVIGDFKATKCQLMQKMLGDLADKGSFDNYIMYIKHSKSFASRWMNKYTDEKMFSVQSRESVCRYGQLMKEHVNRIVRSVVRSTERANTEVSRVEDNKLTKWITEFCNEVDEIPVTPSHLKEFGKRKITDFVHLQDLILQRLETMKSTLIARYCEQNEDTVTWKDETPCEKIEKELWGCPAQCPFCGEPCSLTDAGHYEQTEYPHQCLQHRPKGVFGTKWTESNELSTDTCSFSVQSNLRFSCNFHEDGHKACSLNSSKKDDQFHPYKDYKLIFPQWKIESDPTNTTSKYWAWFMKSYLQKLGDYYQCKLPTLSPAWRTITKEQALGDLR